METWPGSLPTKFIAETYRETPPDNAAEQPMDVGPPKKRLRTTAGIRPVGGTMKMTTAQVATFDTFYDTTLGSGALPFDSLPNQRTSAAVDHIFMAIPRYSPAGPDNWFIEMDLGELP